MDKKSLITIAVIVAMIGGGVAYVLAGQSTSDSTSEADNTSPVPATSSDETQAPNDTQSSVGKYVDYSADAVAATTGTKLLFFHASWCPQCRAMEASIKASNLPSNLTIFKVDYDSHQALRQKYGVTLQTTFIRVNDAGEEIDRYVAYDEPTFDAVKRELLP